MKNTIIRCICIVIAICTISGSVACSAEPANGAPKNVILLIGDGMGMGQMEIASVFEHGKSGGLFLQSLPYTALVKTYSANNNVTDSAAGGTAIAIGKKTNNGMIGLTPDGKEHPSILDVFKENGSKTGIVTTNSVTDATPASFTASVKDRWADQEEIAKQQLKNQIDVIMGGGSMYFGKDEALVRKYKDLGYSLATTNEELAKMKGSKLLGLFASKHLSYKQDREELKSKEPTLSEMTNKTLETLAKGDKGFFAVIEGARIDHAAHSADLTGIWKETVEFDEAVKYCVEWAQKRNDTLVLVAADHETMGLSLTEPLDIKGLKNISISPELMAQKLQKDEKTGTYTKESILFVFQTYAHITLTEEQLADFNKKIKKDNGKLYPEQKVGREIGGMIASHFHAGLMDRPTQQLSSTTGGHTGNMIALFAVGKGAEEFHGVIENTDIPKIIAKLKGYDFVK
ncbi:alkaline phosphatase [Bacillus sp. Au-Bac7]|uniref:alkaline phosphatase n=1 Tax=Bacillus sp. Au-Bac7 TaxID=2906458 RepID=UPI001E2974CE|nr:alkaline phosphatase [Bacillus sp. Au-Bac7]MCE4047085.1 alkaline phosphatase [Bacillus sp. Au-Bac7]